MRGRAYLGVAAALAAGVLVRSSHPAPRPVLWAWERPEDFRFLKPGDASVAVLAKTLILEGPGVLVRPRMQPIEIPQGIATIAVARIETGAAPALNAGQRAAAAGELAELGRRPGVSAVQIDFDATQSQRAFYADLIRDLRRRLPGNVKLTMTALASWCTFDNWISGLPLDEAVPMLFRMGPDGDAVLRRLREGSDFTVKACRGSLGISTDEPVTGMPAGRRLYIFHPRAWTAEAARSAMTLAR